MFIDTHAHLTWGKIKNQTPQILENAQKNNVKKIITIGCNLKTSQESSQYAEQFDNVFFSAGVHPGEVSENINWNSLEKIFSHPKCKAVGECGFDFFYKDFNEELQEQCFIKQIKYSQKYQLPLIIHSREAQTKTLEIIQKYQEIKFVVHCFSGDLNFAKKILDLGGLLSFTGIITYPKTTEIQDTVKYLPLNKIMLETDCPYLAPQSVRGQVNEPQYIVEIAQKIADIKNINLTEVENQTTKNAELFFKI